MSEGQRSLAQAVNWWRLSAQAGKHAVSFGSAERMTRLPPEYHLILSDIKSKHHSVVCGDQPHELSEHTNGGTMKIRSRSPTANSSWHQPF